MDIITEKRTKLVENETLHTQVPMTGTLIISSHDKRLQGGSDAAMGNSRSTRQRGACPLRTPYECLGRRCDEAALSCDERRCPRNRLSQSVAWSTSWLRERSAGKLMHREARVKVLSAMAVDAVFEGVEAYAFRDDPLGTVLFDIEQVDAKRELDARWTELDESHRRSGALRFWRRSADDTRASFAKLVDQGVKWFEVSSSIGMNGWVFCRSFTLR